MVIITVLDQVKKAFTYEEGTIVFDQIDSAFQKDEMVSLSLKGIDAIPSSFANGCFVQLLEKHGIEKIKSSLIIIDSTKQINQMIKSRLTFESQRISDEKTQLPVNKITDDI